MREIERGSDFASRNLKLEGIRASFEQPCVAMLNEGVFIMRIDTIGIRRRVQFRNVERL